MTTPIFEGKDAVVYVHNMTGSLGGCERTAFAVAKAASILGMEAEVVTMTKPVPSREKIKKYFGDEFEDVKVSYREPREDGKWTGEAPFLFFNFSHANYMPNPSTIGVYRLFFPVYSLLKENAPQDVENLCSYNLMLSNSSFTKQYADLRWDFPKERSHVLNSPLRTSIAAKGRRLLENPPLKEKKFLNIGRFENYKNQKLLIDAFMDARERFPILRDWQLVLVGAVAPNEASRDYYQICTEAAEITNGTIIIEHDVVYERLENLLAEAYGYVHGMGAFLPPGKDAHLCEHFGQTMVEAMAHGCFPIVYGRGGIFDVLDVEKGGVPYMTYEGLVEGFLEVAELWDTQDADVSRQKMIEGALDVSFERFVERLADFLKEEMAS